MIYILGLVFAIGGAFGPAEGLRGYFLIAAVILYCTSRVLEKMEGD